MQRHDGLQALSRDHHLALVYAKRLQSYRQAAPSWLEQNWMAVRPCLQGFWENALAGHFAAEEGHLPWDRSAPAWRERLLREHALIARLWREVTEAESAPLERLVELGTALYDHVRWEERELFPAIERATPQAELDLLEARLAHLPAPDPRWLPPKAETSGATEGGHRPLKTP